MKETELRKAYVRACQTKGFEPSEGQFKTWKSTMLFFEAVDLEHAIDMWFEKETNLPMPAELKPVIERARRIRTEKTGAKTYLVAFECPVCGATQSSLLAMEDRGLRYCRGKFGPLLPVDAPRANGQRQQRAQLGDGVTCGAEMRIKVDDRLVSA
jgi:hypothetical protein